MVDELEKVSFGSIPLKGNQHIYKLNVVYVLIFYVQNFYMIGGPNPRPLSFGFFHSEFDSCPMILFFVVNIFHT